ncbi:MAG: O-methyltransferase [Pseudonocardiaceae bacterium]
MLREETVRAYIESTIQCETVELKKLRERVDKLGLDHEEIFPCQVSFLRTLLMSGEIRSVLELGTFVGYSTLNFVECLDALGGGNLVTIDRQASVSEEARRVIYRTSRKTLVEFIVGDAGEYCDRLISWERQFDLIFLDVSEEDYPDLYDRCVPLLTNRGLLIVDNALMPTVAGWNSGDNVIEAPDAEGTITALRALISRTRLDRRVVTSLLPIGSGLLLCRRV